MGNPVPVKILFLGFVIPFAVKMNRAILVIALMLCVTLGSVLDQVNDKNANSFLASLKRGTNIYTCTEYNGSCSNKGSYGECCGEYKCKWVWINDLRCRSAGSW